MSDTPSKPRLSVAAVIVAASVLLVVLAAIIIALVVTLNSTQRTTPTRDDDSGDDEPRTSEIVLDATWDDGESLDDELALTEGLITDRLEAAGITGTEFSIDDNEIHIAFDDDADQETLDAAAEVLEIALSADFRPVLESGLCSVGDDFTDNGPDTESTICDEAGFESFALGVSQVAGEAILAASAGQQDGYEYWTVKIVFDPAGAEDFAALTRQLAESGEQENRLAIVLNGTVLTAPVVTTPILDGEVTISGSFDEARAESLAAQLRFASRGLVLSVESSYLAD